MIRMHSDYDEISPITGNKSVLVEYTGEGVVGKLCMESGYTTNTQFREEFPDFANYLSTLPEVVIDNEVVDEYGFHWFLTVINLGACMLWPDPMPGGWQWAVAPMKFDSGDYVLDLENAYTFPSDQFEDAFEKLYLLYNEAYEKMSL